MISRLTAFFLALFTFFSYTFRFYQPPADADYEISYTKAVKDVEKYCGVTSRVGDHNGVPTLFVNG
ncbi:MAG: hypothetical protein IJT03_03925, partial [Clostridia bacterium]|nr:hypothetical protein [Clostridia bacterium]